MFLFIGNTVGSNIHSPPVIQIQLIFLFIKRCSYCSPTRPKHSNTSYVLVYQILRRGGRHGVTYSNTSYVLVYPSSVRSAAKSVTNSNTSYVLVYPISAAIFLVTRWNSNTSYVLVYLLHLADRTG